MDQINKILTPGDVRAWREKVARSNGTAAVVAGSFDIFQPGNLAVIREARKRAGRVCAVVDSNEHRENRGWTWNPVKTRVEAVAYLRDVSAVTRFPAAGIEPGLRQLRPFIFVDCPSQSAGDPLRQAARAATETCVDLPALPACFTEDISKRILGGHTPVPVNPKLCDAPLSASAAIVRLQALRQGKTLVTVNGCFDILHLGHLRMLAQARRMGDTLVVLINDDASVRAYKGPTRPVFPASFRLTALRALESVDIALPFSGDNPLEMLAQIRPDIHVKGGTYEEKLVREERDLLASWGGRVEFCSLVEGYSTTDLISKARK